MHAGVHTCVGEQSVRAEAHILSQVGGELVWFQSHRPEVMERRLLKQQGGNSQPSIFLTRARGMCGRVRVRRHRGSLAAVVAAPRLCCKDEEPAGRQALIGPAEEADHAHVSRLQVKPLGQAETEDDVIVAPAGPRLLRAHVVALWKAGVSALAPAPLTSHWDKDGSSTHLDEGDVVGEPGGGGGWRQEERRSRERTSAHPQGKREGGEERERLLDLLHNIPFLHPLFLLFLISPSSFLFYLVRRRAGSRSYIQPVPLLHHQVM